MFTAGLLAHHHLYSVPYLYHEVQEFLNNYFQIRYLFMYRITNLSDRIPDILVNRVVPATLDALNIPQICGYICFVKYILARIVLVF